MEKGLIRPDVACSSKSSTLQNFDPQQARVLLHGALQLQTSSGGARRQVRASGMRAQLRTGVDL